MKTKAKNNIRQILIAIVLVGLLIILCGYILVLRNEKSKLEDNLLSLESYGANMLIKNGYNVIDQKITIANPGHYIDYSGSITSYLELTVAEDGTLYLKDYGDFNASQLCRDTRAERVAELGSNTGDAALFSPGTKGCTQAN